MILTSALYNICFKKECKNKKIKKQIKNKKNNINKSNVEQ
jgi:hypothetical protein